MILVDTSVWIDHVRRADQDLDALLAEGRVMAHPFVIGELALGSLRTRSAIVASMGRLARSVVAFHDDVMSLIERYGLSGSGIGYVDAHLVASARLTPAGRLWTRDRRLRSVADRLGVNWVAA